MVNGLLGGLVGGASVTVVIRAVDKFSKEFDNLNRTLGIAGAAITGFGIAGAAVIGGTLVQASKLEESVNAVNVVFGDGADVIKEFGKTSATSVGLATSEFNQMGSQIGALLADTGVPMTEVADMTTDLAVRAADMASVMDTNVADAFYAINQAIRGETEAIRRYTGDVTDATLEQYLLANGINKSVTELTQQEKRLYRVQLIMKQTDKFAGDFANTQDSFANILRILDALWKDVAGIMGNVFLPVAEKVLEVVQMLVGWFKEHETIAIFAAVVLGVSTALALIIGPIAIMLAMLPLLTAGFASLSMVTLPITGTILLIGAAVLGVVAAIAAVIAIFMKWNDLSDRTKKILLILGGPIVWLGVLLRKLVDNWDEIIIQLQIGLAIFKNAWIIGWNFILDYLANKINNIIGLINGLISAYNSVAGFFGRKTVGLLSEVSFEGMKGQLEDIDALGKKLREELELRKSIREETEKTKEAVNEESSIVDKLKSGGFRAAKGAGGEYELFKAGAFTRSEFQSDFAYEQAKRGGVEINIENVNGLDPTEVANAMQEVLENKISV